MLGSITQGLKAAGKHPRLVFLLWAWYALLSLGPAMPAYAWLSSAMSGSPAAASALRRFDFGLLGELSNYDQSSVMGLLISAVMAGGIVAFLSSAFVMGGVLEIFSSDGETRPFTHRFFRGAGHFFWRFLRLAVIGGVCVAIAVAIVAAAVGAATSPMADTQWEPGRYLAGFLTVLAVAATAALFLLGLDYARVRVARDGSRGMFRAYFSSLGFVFRHLVPAYAMGLSFVIIVVAAVMLYVAYETNAPAAATGAAIATLFVLQQAAVFVRVFARVGLIGAERDYFGRMSPVPVPVTAPVIPAVSHAAPEIEPTSLAGVGSPDA